MLGTYQTLSPKEKLLLSSHSIRTGIGRAHGTFGELLQGELPGGSGNFLVTFPVSLQSVVTFQPQLESSLIESYPSGKMKSIKLARKLLDEMNIASGGTLVFLEYIPEGKGLASSSADMVATARAIADYYKFTLNNTLLAKLLGTIEPTDGVMYDECVSFFHRRCQLIERLGILPSLVVLAIDEGSTIDTLHFNATARAYTPAEIAEFKTLLETISEAIQCTDKYAIGRVATRSASVSQNYNPKHNFQPVMETAIRTDALGVVVAHSGTYIGVLLDPMQPNFANQFNQVQTSLLRFAKNIEIFRSF